MTGSDGKAQAGLYLVVIGDIAIAEDLRQAICDARAGAVMVVVVVVVMVVVVRAVVLAGSALAGSAPAGAGGVAMAFICDEGAALAGTALAARFAAHGTRVVRTGYLSPAQAATLGQEALQYPFSAENVQTPITGRRGRMAATLV